MHNDIHLVYPRLRKLLNHQGVEIGVWYPLLMQHNPSPAIPHLFAAGGMKKNTASVASLVKFWTPEIYTNLLNFWQYFASSLNYTYFHALTNISWEITYTMLFNILIFDNRFKLQFLPKFWKRLQNFWNIQSSRPKFSRNFRAKYWQNFRYRNTKRGSPW